MTYPMPDNIKKLENNLSTAFFKQVIKYPGSVKHLPEEANLVFASSRYPKLTQKNLKIAKNTYDAKGHPGSHLPWYEIRRKKGRWVARKLDLSKIFV